MPPPSLSSHRPPSPANQAIPISTTTNNGGSLHPDLPDLQDDDVALLYEIIKHAEQSPSLPDLPWRALFAAYETILPRYGLSSQYDQIYLRFLLRLGARLGRSSNNGHEEEKEICTEFKGLLLELGIELKIGSSEGEGESIQGEETTYEEEYRENGEGRGDKGVGEPEWKGQRRERRASFSGVFEADDESTREVKRRADSRSSVSRLQDHSGGFGAKGFRTRNRRGAGQEERGKERQRQRRQEATDTRDINTQPVRHKHPRDDGQTAEASRRPSETLQGNTRSRRETRRLHSGQNRRAREIPIYEDPSDRESTRQEQYSEPSIQPPPSRPSFIYRPSETQLFRDADTYDHFRLREVLRRLIRRWKNLALAARDRRKAMLQRAEVHDRRTLLRQALTEFHNKYLVRKNEAETELFFRNLSDRAARVRDNHILTKAFTHWAASTSELSEQNAVARRHIVRFRHFNAWKEITAINELKVRRLTLQRFLDLWRRRFISVQNQNNQAIATSNRNTVEQSYWTWFWIFCARRAPEWRHARLKNGYFLRWLVGTRAREEQNLRVDASRADALRQSLLGHWHQRARVTLLKEQQADAFRRRKLLSRTLSTLQQQAIFVPLLQRVQGLVNWRVASTALTTLIVRARVYARAREVDRQRTVRNAWTTWNDRLRWQTLQHQINDRLATQALYKWVLAERTKLLTRLNQERTQERALRRIAAKNRELDERLGLAEVAVIQAGKTRLASAVLAQWCAKQREQQQREERALEFLTPQATGKCMLQWHAAEELQRERERTAVETIWYFRVTRSFRALAKKKEENVKIKRKEAYISVRRMVKMNQARGMLDTWRRRMEVVRDISEEAERIVEVRNEELIRRCLEIWTGRVESCFDMAIEAEQKDNEKTLGRALGVWVGEARGRGDQAGMAEEFLRSKVERTAYDCLRRLRLKSLEVRSLEARLGWNEQRRVRGILKGWAERTSARRRGDGERQKGAGSGDTGPLLSHGRTSLLSLTRTPRSTRSRNFLPAEPEPSVPLEAVAGTTPFSIPSTALVPVIRTAAQDPRISSSSLFNRAVPSATQRNPASNTNFFQPSQSSFSQSTLQPFQSQPQPPLSTFAPSASLSTLTTPLPPHLSTPSHRAARARALGQQKQALARPSFSSLASALGRQQSSTQPPSLTKAPSNPSITVLVGATAPPSSRSLFRQSTSYTPLSHPPPTFRNSTLLSTSRITEESDEGEGEASSPLRPHSQIISRPTQLQAQNEDEDADADNDITQRQSAFLPTEPSTDPTQEAVAEAEEADSFLSTYPQLSTSTTSSPPAPAPAPGSGQTSNQNQNQTQPEFVTTITLADRSHSRSSPPSPPFFSQQNPNTNTQSHTPRPFAFGRRSVRLPDASDAISDNSRAAPSGARTAATATEGGSRVRFADILGGNARRGDTTSGTIQGSRRGGPGDGNERSGNIIESGSERGSAGVRRSLFPLRRRGGGGGGGGSSV